MKLVCELNQSLPKLAWLAVVDQRCGSTRVVHGAAVETAEAFFVEGVWDGDFGAGQFTTTDCFFGSGARVDDDAISFVSSASTTDYLYHCSIDGAILVSNSLPLLLAHCGRRLDPDCAMYDRINRSIMDGIDRYERQIPTMSAPVTRLMYRNLRVTARGVTEYDRQLPPPFADYTSYRNYLAERYAVIAANARSAARQRPMPILSTQSRGYDTTALNAIAAVHGVDRAFTIQRGKTGGAFAVFERGAGADDDGTEICALLGIPCTPIDRRAFERDFSDEDLYWSTIEANQDANLKEISRYVDGVAVLLTGTLGEMWYTTNSYERYQRDPSMLDDGLKRVDLGGHGLTEVRLTAGIIHAPFPYIGARRRPDIACITESAAMSDWRLNNSYDRPIARRLAEEAGVPRSMFGQTKTATVVEFPPPPLPYGKALRAEYFAFLVRFNLLRRWQTLLFPLVHRINSILVFTGEHRYAAVHYFQRAISKIRRREFRFSMLWRRLDGKLFCFCVNRRADAYETVLRGSTDQRRGGPPEHRYDGGQSARPSSSEGSMMT